MDAVLNLKLRVGTTANQPAQFKGLLTLIKGLLMLKRIHTITASVFHNFTIIPAIGHFEDTSEKTAIIEVIEYFKSEDGIDVFRFVEKTHHLLTDLIKKLNQREFDVRFGALKSKTYKTTKIMV